MVSKAAVRWRRRSPEVAQICREEEVIGDFEEGCFCAVM